MANLDEPEAHLRAASHSRSARLLVLEAGAHLCHVPGLARSPRRVGTPVATERSLPGRGKMGQKSSRMSRAEVGMYPGTILRGG
jgi:hypothetical protein